MTMLSPKKVHELVVAHAGYLQHNANLIDIYEGNLLEHLLKDIKEQFDSPQMQKQMAAHTVPINVVPKIIDKETNIYQTTVTRQVLDGKASDKKLLSWYAENIAANSNLNVGNEMFNLCRTCLIQPYAHKQKPNLRIIQNDRFIAHSEDAVEPHKPTHFILLCGKNEAGDDLYHTYSADEFMISNSKEQVEGALMARIGNEEGVNPVGRLPFTYINSSKFRIAPKQDSDIIKLAKVIPIMLSDLNMAARYQAFSILYGIDLDDENMVMGPSVFWRFKSDAVNGNKPEIGMLKPSVDFTQVLGLIQAEFSLWLGTRGIRASSVGQLSPENFASGISKVIDEMDTYESREKQTGFFQAGEEDLWELICHGLHPLWVAAKEIDQKALFTANAKVKTEFAVQLPAQNRGQVVKDLKEEHQAGFITRRRALMKLNPELTEEEIDDLIAEIDAEKIENGSQMDENQPVDSEGSQAKAEGEASGFGG